MPSIRAVLFDVDGVLVDSLDAHLRICRDKSDEYGLGLAIPTAAELKAMLRRGVVISPMKHFFLAVGFSEMDAERADDDYRREFMVRYKPEPFDGVKTALEELSAARVPLGLVTSNTLANVQASLGDLMAHFDPRCLFARDHSAAPTKPEALCRSAEVLGAEPAELLYVGDQRQDFDAAARAGTQFLGVGYGWGIDATDRDFDTVSTPQEIATYVLERRPGA